MIIARLLLFLFLIVPAMAESERMLDVSADVANFGYVPQMAEVSRTIVLTSNAKDTIRIGRIDTFCDCIVGTFGKTVIPPGDSTTLELRLNTQRLGGKMYKATHLYDVKNVSLAKIVVKASIYNEDAEFKTIYVEPRVINFSQFGDALIDNATFEIVNITDDTVPLKLLFANNEYFVLDFPVFVEPNKRAEGIVTLTDAGKNNEFSESITFEYINDKSEKFLFTLPVKRKVFGPKSDAEGGY